MAVKLTPKQQMVVNQLLIDPSLKLCCEVTGVSYDYVRELHTKTHILAILDERRAVVREKAENIAAVDAAWVLQEQRRVYERTMNDEDFKQSANATRALDSIAKHKNVDAFVRNGDDGKLDAPTSGEWTVRIVHTSKDEYERSIGNGKPPIEHQSK